MEFFFPLCVIISCVYTERRRRRLERRKQYWEGYSTAAPPSYEPPAVHPAIPTYTQRPAQPTIDYPASPARPQYPAVSTPAVVSELPEYDWGHDRPADGYAPAGPPPQPPPNAEDGDDLSWLPADAPRKNFHSTVLVDGRIPTTAKPKPRINLGAVTLGQ